MKDLKEEIQALKEYRNEVNAIGKIKLCQATHNQYAEDLDKYTSACTQTVQQINKELFYFKTSYTNLVSTVSTEQLAKPRPKKLDDQNQNQKVVDVL